MIETLVLFRKTLGALDSKGKTGLLVYILIQIALSAFDAIALIIVSRTFNFQTPPQVNEASIRNLLIATALFMAKSAFATFFTWQGTKTMAKQEVQIGQQNLTGLLNLSWKEKTQYKISDFITLIDRGPTVLIQGFLMSVSNLISEIAGSIAILVVVFFIQPITASAALLYFGLVALIQHKALAGFSSLAGKEVYRHGNITNDVINDIFHLSKLLMVTRSTSLEGFLKSTRQSLAGARGFQGFIATIPRYFMETVLALGFVAIGLVTYLVIGISAVAPAIAIFGIAGFRLLPSINRIQGLFLSAIGYAPIAGETIRDWEKTSYQTGQKINLPDDVLIAFKDVSFSYRNESQPALSDINIEIMRGKNYALVGPSGSGKTTFVDMCLGLLLPTKGTIVRSNSILTEGQAYVPQDSYLASVGIQNNVALEWDDHYVDSERAQRALKDAMLEISDSTTKLQAKTSPPNLKLSGGQRQRLGIARALYRNAHFLVLDEATSSLDSKTESEVGQSLNNTFKGKTTITVAHRLSTIRNAEQIIYLEAGRILGIGTFTQLLERLPQFKTQVDLGKV